MSTNVLSNPPVPLVGRSEQRSGRRSDGVLLTTNSGIALPHENVSLEAPHRTRVDVDIMEASNVKHVKNTTHGHPTLDDKFLLKKSNAMR